MDELETAMAARFVGGCGGGGFTGFTTSVTFAEWDKLPLVPVMVNVNVPVAVEAAVVMFKVEDPEPLIDAGLKLADAPDGRPPALSPTVPVNPFCAAMVTVYLVLFPATTVRVAGVAE